LNKERKWGVLFIGGASGTGKSSINIVIEARPWNSALHRINEQAF
jgi:2-phosphoglycerate kinase